MSLSNVIRVAQHSFHASLGEDVSDNEEGVPYYAGYIIEEIGQPLSLPLTVEMKRELAKSLFDLHSRDQSHGDPRVANALMHDGQLKWIDFRTAHYITPSLDRIHDVKILAKSILGREVDAEHEEEVEIYAREISQSGLEQLLLKL
jgi:tRNA A-37 threonylcarbamoyl transferase component Bud32